MLASVDSVGPYRQPRRDENEWLGCAIFISFILLGSFFVLNLCVGVIVDTYGEVKGQKGRLFVTPAQQDWIVLQKALYVKKRFFMQTNLHNLTPTRAHLIKIVTSVAFERTIMVCIIVNTVCFAMEVYPSPGKLHRQILDTSSIVFRVIFNIEAGMKIAALKRNYFRENWNLFDFVCVVVSDGFWIFDAVKPKGTGDTGFETVISSIRVLRTARLFRLVRFLKGLNQLFFAFILSIPKLVNVATIMLLLIYMYAILGMNLFATVAFPADGTLNYNANFRTFPVAMVTLIRSMTGEAWNEIMHDLSKSKFELQSVMGIPCEDSFNMPKVLSFANISSVDRKDLYFFGGPDWSPNECGSPVAFVYFITYTMMVTFVMLNLFIAVIFEGFEESSKSDVAELIRSCCDIWKRYDPDRRMLISVDRVFDFIDECVEHLCVTHGKPRDFSSHLEPRWESEFALTSGYGTLAQYSLRYVQINDITVTPQREVRFVVAVRAVIRQMLCNGGLNGHLTDRQMRWDRHKELLALSNALEDGSSGPIVEKELLKLQRLEYQQSRTIRSNLGLGAYGRRGESVPEEMAFVRDVAAAKLQRHLRILARRAKMRKQRETELPAEDIIPCPSPRAMSPGLVMGGIGS